MSPSRRAVQPWIPILLLLALLPVSLHASPSDGAAPVRPGAFQGQVPDTVPAPDTVPGADTIPLPDFGPDPGAIQTPVLPAVLDTLPVTDPLAEDTASLVALDAVVVDILQSPVSLQQVPFAISILGDEVRSTGRSSSSIEEALHGLPGVQVQNRFNAAVGERIVIRGFGARSPFGVRGVRIVVDGIPATLPDGQSTLDHLDLGNLGRVEALRGPGSALYGNAAGGVLVFETRAPSASPIRQDLESVSGDHGFRRLQATTSGSIGDGGYLISLGRYELDGFRWVPDGFAHERYGATNKEQLNTQFTFPLLGGDTRISGNALRLQADNPGSLARPAMLLEDRRAFQSNVTQGAGMDLEQGQLGVGWEGQVGERAVELMTYGIRRVEDSPGTSAVVDLNRSAGGVRVTMRSEQEGDAGLLWWALGSELNLQRDQRRHFRNTGGQRGSPLLDQSERVLGSALFLQAMLPINPILSVLTGLRYDRIRFSADDHLAGVQGRPDGSGVRTLDSASPSFGFHTRLHPAISTYLSLATAFETPTTTELANDPDGMGGFNEELEPQVGFTIEAGARGILGMMLAYEATYFHTTLHGELVAFEVEDEPGAPFFRNSGRSIREGVELALQFTPSPYLRTRLTFATNEARFREFEVNGDDLAGNRVPGLAPSRVEGLIRVGPGSWFTEVRTERTAAIPGNDRNDVEALSPAYGISDVRLGVNELELGSLRLTAYAGVTNLLDAYYNTSVVVNAAGGRYFEPGPGRNAYFGGSIGLER